MATVLVCDDMKTDREMLGKIVESQGHTLVYAKDGEEAFTLAKQLRPQLILLDVVMPGDNGFSVCRKLKKEPLTSKIPIVMVTSKNASTDKFWAEKQGADGYVVKPFQPHQISDEIQKHI